MVYEKFKNKRDATSRLGHLDYGLLFFVKKKCCNGVKTKNIHYGI